MLMQFQLRLSRPSLLANAYYGECKPTRPGPRRLHDRHGLKSLETALKAQEITLTGMTCWKLLVVSLMQGDGESPEAYE